MLKNKVRLCEAAMLISLCAALCAGTWAQGRQSELSAQLVRLHVIAASDDEYEQELKLRVRDSVLEYLTPMLENAQDPAAAREIIRRELGSIRTVAQKSSEGRAVTVALSQEYYPTREYDSFSLPAGRYESLRITLGEGKGHNWWCVVFPPLCVSAAEQNKALDAMSDDDRALITEADGYELRFRIVELWGELMNFIEKSTS